MITPNTDLYLLKVPLEINNLNQLTFANTTAQFNYFNSLPKVEAENFTYQRKDGTVRFEGKYDELITYNYCMYRNNEYSDKWFYAYIVDMEYVNDNMTMIQLKSDTWQCWQFDLTFKPVLIDREHVNDDTIGANILEEGLELGEFVTNGTVENFGLNVPVNGSLYDQFVTIIEVSQLENTGESQTLSYSWSGSQSNPTRRNGGVYSSLYRIVVDPKAGAYEDEVIGVYDRAGLSGAIQNMYVIPRNLLGSLGAQTGLTITANAGQVTEFSASNLGMPRGSLNATFMGQWDYNRPTSIDGYVPHNNKLLTYPYNYLNVSNNAGTVIPYHYEDFDFTNYTFGRVEFLVEGVITPSGSIKAYPRRYKNINTGSQSYNDDENAYDFGITSAKFPMCNWTSDSYTNWLTQNAVNMQTQWRTAITHGLIGIGKGGLNAGMEASEIPTATGEQILSTATFGMGIPAIGMASNLIAVAREQHLAKTQANMTPDQARGNENSGDIVFAKLRSLFTFMPMSIKASMARCIDEYFDQYGYKCNRVKVPNLTGRRNWNYVKTVGCYIEADIPQGDLAEIRGMFDNGITLWHNPATFADYSQNNDIIG